MPTDDKMLCSITPFLSTFDAKRIEDRYPDDVEVRALVDDYKRARAYLSGLCAAVRVTERRVPRKVRELVDACPEGQAEGKL